MNTDDRSLLERMGIENPINIGVVVALILSIVLFAVAITSLVGVVRERTVLEGDYESTVSSIARLRAEQQSPESLRQRIGEVNEELRSLLAGVPTRRQVRGEIIRYYTYANNADVELVRVERVAASSGEGDQGFYDRQRFLVEAQGRAPNLMRFLARVGSGPYDTFVLSNIYISPDGPSTANADLEVFSSDLSADEPVPYSSSATLSTEDESVAPEHDPALALGDELQRAVIAGDWGQVVSLGEQLLRAEGGSEYVQMVVYEGHVRIGYELLSKGEFIRAREHFQAALAIIPGGQEAQEGLETLQGQTSGENESDTETSDMLPGEAPSGLTVHVVRRGESLSLLARRYDTTVQELMQLNSLRGTTIYIGQELLVPLR